MRSSRPRTWYMGTYAMPAMTRRLAVQYLSITLVPIIVGLTSGAWGVVLGGLIVGVGLFLLRNWAVAREVADGWHDPVYGEYRRAQRQNEQAKTTRPLAIVMGLIMASTGGALLLLEQHHLIRLPQPRSVVVLQSLQRPWPPCCAPFPSPESSPEAVHRTWDRSRHAVLRAR